MMRLPHFKYHAPRSAQEAADLLAIAPGETMLVAGGTDVLPNMKRRQQVPATLIGLRRASRPPPAPEWSRPSHRSPRRPPSQPTRSADEVLTSVRLPRLEGWRSTYWKLRRRGAFDFPVLSVAAAVKIAADGTVDAARIVLGAVASCPIEAAAAGALLVGGPLTDE